jgi:DNA-binding MarR family transcriptional regulator
MEAAAKIEDSSKICLKLIYLLKRLNDDWLSTKLCHSHHCDFNNAHMPVFMSIGADGISNNKLAAQLNVTKQSASKTIKELEKIGLVRSERSGSDARSVMLYYTAAGEQFYTHIKVQVMELEGQYKKLVGQKNYDTTIDVLLKMIDFHEDQKKKLVVV